MTGARKNRPLVWVLVVAGIALLLCGGAVAALGVVASNVEPDDVFTVTTDGSDGWTATPDQNRVVVLEVTTSGKGTVSWNVNGQGGSDTNATFPYRRTLGPFNIATLFLALTVQDTSGANAPLQARIVYGDKVFPCEATGAYAVATCSGTG